MTVTNLLELIPVYLQWIFLLKVWFCSIPSLLSFRDENPAKTDFFQHLIEDRTEAAFSYYEFLLNIQQQICKWPRNRQKKVWLQTEAWAKRSIWEVTKVNTYSSQYTVTSTVLDALQLKEYTFPKEFCRFPSV